MTSTEDANIGVTHLHPRLSLVAIVGFKDAVEMISYFQRRVAEGVQRLRCRPELMWSETLAAVGRGGDEVQILAATAAAQGAIDAGEISAGALNGISTDTADE